LDRRKGSGEHADNIQILNMLCAELLFRPLASTGTLQISSRPTFGASGGTTSCSVQGWMPLEQRSDYGEDSRRNDEPGHVNNSFYGNWGGSGGDVCVSAIVSAILTRGCEPCGHSDFTTTTTTAAANTGPDDDTWFWNGAACGRTNRDGVLSGGAISEKFRTGSGC